MNNPEVYWKTLPLPGGVKLPLGKNIKMLFIRYMASVVVDICKIYREKILELEAPLMTWVSLLLIHLCCSRFLTFKRLISFVNEIIIMITFVVSLLYSRSASPITRGMTLIECGHVYVYLSMILTLTCVCLLVKGMTADMCMSTCQWFSLCITEEAATKDKKDLSEEQKKEELKGPAKEQEKEKEQVCKTWCPLSIFCILRVKHF